MLRIFTVLFILLATLRTGSALAQDDVYSQSNLDNLPGSTSNLPPPPVDEYNNVPPGLLMSGDAIPLQSASESGQVDQDVMTMDDLVSAYNRQQYDVVAKHIVPIANGSYPQAEELLGIMYFKGQGVPEDAESAVSWLTKAAEADRPLAQHYLATLTYQGTGTPQDSVRALMWLYIAIVHYPDGAEKTRAMADRDNVATRLSRRDRTRAYQLAHDWLKKKDEAALLDQMSQ